MADSPIFRLLSEDELGVWPLLNDSWSEESYDLEGLMAKLTVYQVHTLLDSYITPDDKNSSVYSLQVGFENWFFYSIINPFIDIDLVLMSMTH